MFWGIYLIRPGGKDFNQDIRVYADFKCDNINSRTPDKKIRPEV